MMLWAASMFELVGSTNNTQALRASRGIDHSLHTHMLMPTGGLADTTPKPCVQSGGESEQAIDCTQYIVRSLSATDAIHTSGVGGDLPTCGASSSLIIRSNFMGVIL
jgi:hypothetical protein